MTGFWSGPFAFPAGTLRDQPWSPQISAWTWILRPDPERSEALLHAGLGKKRSTPGVPKRSAAIDLWVKISIFGISKLQDASSAKGLAVEAVDLIRSSISHLKKKSASITAKRQSINPPSKEPIPCEEKLFQSQYTTRGSYGFTPW